MEKIKVINQNNYNDEIILKCNCINCNTNFFITEKQFNNYGCIKCSSIKRPLSFNLIKYILEVEFQHLNLELIDENQTAFKYIKVKCKICNLIYNKTVSTIYKNVGCSSCAYKCKADKLKFNYDDVKKIIESFNLQLISDEYINTSTPLEVKCLKCNHISKKKLGKIKNGAGCTNCNLIKLGDSKRMDINEVTQILKNNNLELYNDTYVNCDTPLSVKCLICSNISTRTLYRIKKGSTCDTCGSQRRKDKLKLDINYVKQFVTSFGFELISDNYINDRTPIELKCKSDHIFKRTLGDLRKCHSCPECSFGCSYPEYLCKKFLEYLFDVPFNKIRPKWLKSENDTLMELDMYNEDLKIALEYNGIQHYEYVKYFHEEKEDFIKRQSYDKLKYELCEQNNIKLIIVPCWIKDSEKLEFIKKECDKLNIRYIIKPDITIKELDITNTKINIKNKYIDDLLKHTNWKRTSNYFSTSNNIEILCLKCNTSNKLKYTSLMTNLNNNRTIKCRGCYCIKKYIALNKILLNKNFIAVEHYIDFISKIKIQCLVCNTIKKVSPKNIFKTNIKCEICPSN